MQNDNHSAVLLVLVDVLSNKFFYRYCRICCRKASSTLSMNSATALAVCFDVTVKADIFKTLPRLTLLILTMTAKNVGLEAVQQLTMFLSSSIK